MISYIALTLIWLQLFISVYLFYYIHLFKYTYCTLKLFEMPAESSSLIARMDVDEAAIDEGLYSRQL